MLDDSERQRLREELTNAHAEYVAASTLFDSLVTDTASGFSWADGTLRIQQIGLE